MKSLVALTASALTLCLPSCNLPGRADGIDPNPFHLLEKQATAANRDMSRLRVPVLRSPELEKRWGKPRMLVGPKGGYAMRYTDRKHNDLHLTIFGSPEMYPMAGLTPPPYTELIRKPGQNTIEPVEVEQMWRLVTISGRLVRYCVTEGGADGQPVEYSTETFRLTAADGREASYRIRVSTAGVLPSDRVAALMETLSFESGDR